MKLSVLLLLLVCARTAVQSNTISLTPQMCKQVGSVLIDCACDSFLGDINGIIAVIFTHYNVTEMATSTFQIRDIFSVENLMPVMTPILKDALSLCRNISGFDSCLKENGFASSNKMPDVIARSFISLENIKPFFYSMCDFLEEIQTNLNCVAGKVLPATGCIMPVTTDFSRLYLNLSSPTISSDLVNGFCPHIGDISRCLVAQIYTCSSKFDSDVSKMTQQTTSACKSKMAEGTKSPLASPLVYCGIGVYPEIINVSATPNSVRLLTPNMMFLVDTICGWVPRYFQCLARELPKSSYPLDLNLQELLDFSQVSASMMKPVCDIKQDVANTLFCMTTETIAKKADKCVNPDTLGHAFASGNITSMVFQGDALRSQLCTPLHNMMTCILDIINGTCSREAATVGYKMFPEVLRIDCNGTRSKPPLTTTPLSTNNQIVGDGSDKVIFHRFTILIPYVIVLILSF